MRRLRIGLTAIIALLTMSFTLASNTRLLSNTPLAKDTYEGCFAFVTIVDEFGPVTMPSYTPPNSNQICYDITDVWEDYPPFEQPSGPIWALYFGNKAGGCSPVSSNICCYEITYINALQDYYVTGVCYGEFYPDSE